jgi:hypothetical protein
VSRRYKKNSGPDLIARIGFVRIITALLIACVGGWLAFSLAVAGVTRVKNPQATLTFMPSDSTALAKRADQLLLPNPAKPPLAVERHAKEALRQQAANAPALRILGYVAEASGDRKRAFGLINMSARLSRRDGFAQQWLIEYYAQANDTATTLRHYDIALTAEPAVSGLLYPRLDRAIADADIRAALIPYLKRERPWMSSFINHAVNSQTDPASIVALIVEAGGLPKEESYRVQELGLLQKLTSQNRFVEARRIYGLVPGNKPVHLTNPSFVNSDRDAKFGPMGWVIANDPSAGGGFIGKKGTNSPALSLFANSATTRMVASRLLFLPEGSYNFSTKLSRLELGQGGYLQFQLRCLDGDVTTPAWVMSVTTRSAAATVSVPANCNAQSLDIVASGGQGQTGLEGQVDVMSLLPVQAANY